MSEIAVQDEYGPNGTCFGCGPKNDKGLQIKSYWDREDFVLKFTPKPHHRAFQTEENEGILNGGIIGALFDCHQNWLSATSLHKIHPEKNFPSTVTSNFCVNLRKPTPTNGEITIIAEIDEIKDKVVKTKAKMYADGEITATSTGTFISVKEGHPAYHRWN